MLQEVIEGLIYAVFGTIVFLVLIVIPIFVFGPSFEAKFFPVLTDVDVIPVLSLEGDPTYSHYQLKYTKSRYCTGIPETRAWFILQGDKETRVSIVTTNSDSSDFTPPPGEYTSNVWEIDNQRFGPVDAQKLVLTYDCHPFWMTQTTINIPIGVGK